MFDLDKWGEIYATLSRNKLRTFLTALGVGWGILMLVLMVGAGNGLQNGVRKAFAGAATNSFFVWGQTTSMTYRGLKENRYVRFENSDAEALRRLVPGAEVIAPRNQLGGWRGNTVVTRGLQSAGFSVFGDYPEVKKIESVGLLLGRFINYLDISETRKVCVIGRRVREVLFNPEEAPIGQQISINGVYFTVIGVFKSDMFGGGGDANERIYVPFTTFQRAFNYGNEVGFWAVTAKPNIPASLVERQVMDVLKRRHGVHPEDVRAIGHFNLEEEFKKLELLFLGIRLLIFIVGTGTLLAGAIGVSNIMLIIVKERTKEIGIRRALGATPRVILNQIMSESVALTFLAGYAGLVLGVVLLEGLNAAMQQVGSGQGGGGGDVPFANPGISWQMAAFSVGILLVFGLLAGILPARRALAINAVEALRADG